LNRGKKSCPKICATSVSLKKIAQSVKTPNWQKCAKSGHTGVTSLIVAAFLSSFLSVGIDPILISIIILVQGQGDQISL
jgi:hypothetical protein